MSVREEKTEMNSLHLACQIVCYLMTMHHLLPGVGAIVMAVWEKVASIWFWPSGNTEVGLFFVRQRT